MGSISQAALSRREHARTRNVHPLSYLRVLVHRQRMVKNKETVETLRGQAFLSTEASSVGSCSMS